MDKPLWEHQVQAIRAAEILPDLGLFFEQGTGKTRTTIEILRRRFAHEKRLLKTLIVCPQLVCKNWKDEFRLFSKINPNDIVILQDSQKKRVKRFIENVGEDLSRARIVITNYEALQMGDLFKLLLQWNPTICVADESQRVKSHDSIRAKTLVNITDRTRHNYILSGTPFLNSPADFFMQFRVLDRGAVFGRNFYSFRNRYFHDAEPRRPNEQRHFPKWECTEEMYQAIQDKVRTKAIRVLKQDCLDLPPLVRTKLSTGLSPEQARMYREMYNEYITFIDAKREEPAAVVAQLAITKALRLQQIVSGFVKDETGTIHRLDCPRLKVLEEALVDLAPHHKVIVWSVFKENYKMIAEVCQKLELGYTELHGDLNATEKNEQMNLFRTDPSKRVMIANQAAGGVGVNLVEASYSIYYSKGFRLEDDLQSEARNHRGGSEIHEKVTRIDIVAEGTIDELITKALAEKQRISDKILGWKDNLCSFE